MSFVEIIQQQMPLNCSVAGVEISPTSATSLSSATVAPCQGLSGSSSSTSSGLSGTSTGSTGTSTGSTSSVAGAGSSTTPDERRTLSRGCSGSDLRLQSGLKR